MGMQLSLPRTNGFPEWRNRDYRQSRLNSILPLNQLVAGITGGSEGRVRANLVGIPKTGKQINRPAQDPIAIP